MPRAELDEAAVLALAPDDAGRKAGRSLALPGLWAAAARDDGAAWGQVRGSGRDPYRVQLDLSAPAWSCACPSRKQPCKHAVGLLLLVARSQLPDGARPSEVGEWVAGRAGRAATKAAPLQRSRSGEVADPAAQARRRERRQANVDAGIIDLERWLDDLVRSGLATASSRSWATWDEAAARLVDAQAPGLASRVRSMAWATHSGPGWPDRLLGQLGRLHLVLEGWRHLAELPPALAAEVRTQVGFPTSRADVAATTAVRDRWDVLAANVADDGTLATRRVWLRGRTVGGWALLLDTGPSGAAFDTDVQVGTTVEADVHRYPGAAGQRSLVGERHGDATPITELEGAAVGDVLAADALALASSPWLASSPACLGAVVPVVDGDRWLLVDEGGDGLRLDQPAWDVLALSGGHPVAVVGEWDGARLTPLACLADGQLWSRASWASLGRGAGTQADSEGRHPAGDTVSPDPWPQLVKAALLGTQRTGRPGADRPDGQVGVLVDAVVTDPERAAERVLLAAAAAVATAGRAGRPAERAVAPAPAPAPAPAVDCPPAGAAAAGTLAALLGGTWRQLLPEWLEACRSFGRRVPSVLLPALLDGATTDRALRPAAREGIGGRGRWLASQRPEWSWAGGSAAGEVPDDPATAWAEGTAAERRVLLAAVRAVDPVLGRSLVQSTWGTDRADDRAAFVELLATGGSMADEPFLEERGLSDRGRDVRRAAAAALARLPGSRLAARMQERATAHLTGGDEGAAFVVRLPEELPPAWAADGVDRQPRRAVGERAWWLAQVVAAAPLDAWGPPAQAVAAARRAEHAEAVLWGWTTASVRQRRTDWAAAVLDGAGEALPGDAKPELLRVLDPQTRASWIAGSLDRAARGGAAPFLGLVGEVPRPWPKVLVRAVAGRAAAAVLEAGPAAHAARPALLLLAERADPGVLDRLVADLSQASGADRRLEAELRRPVALAQLRCDLLAELHR